MRTAHPANINHIAAGANAHPGEGMQHGQGGRAQQQGMQGGMGQGMGQGMMHGMHANAGHGPMQGMGPGAGSATPNAQGPRGPNTGSTLTVAPASRRPRARAADARRLNLRRIDATTVGAAMREKMQNAKTPEERRAIAMANRTEMEKRAAEQGTAHTHRGPRFGATTN